ncbi:DUF4381 domain-containing protein [Ruminobacter sp. RM87]|jgi:hypothetical protein|uniref:DUF4381 domain-containing protein n=1 Tax=Ruminobacter sp. RM87 TaxID=1200567 RepID=UPI0004E0E70D|nr:DUF4381 domain-containing protein [Ruminobacter sp. RM87]
MEFDFSLLRDIHEGEPPVDFSYGFLWWIVLIVILAVICYSVYRLLPLFAAIKRLNRIDLNNEAFIPLINYWLKETALIMYPRDVVAPLYGLNWLRFLDQTGNTNFEAFTNAWEEVIYDWQNIEVPISEKKMLVKECKKWIYSNIRRRIWGR